MRKPSDRKSHNAKMQPTNVVSMAKNEKAALLDATIKVRGDVLNRCVKVASGVGLLAMIIMERSP